MALQDQGAAPYTSPSSVINVVERFRDRGLSTPLDVEVLIRAGISEGLAPRTIYALGQLDLIDDDGNPTEALNGLRLASSDSYRERFAEVIRAAYSPVFKYVDPATDSVERVRDAFRPYTPVGQQGRMVTLFLGLCEYAGIIAERPKAVRPVPSAAPKREQRKKVGQAQEHDIAFPIKPILGSKSHRAPATLLTMLEEALPDPGRGWTQERRDRFLDTFKVLLDFSVPVVEATDSEEVSDEEG